MQWLAGVDEAGLGPILGPLVIAGIAFTGEAGSDPWSILQSHVSRLRHEKGKVRVADSKKVHSGVHGLRRLEETSLTFWAVLHGELPATVEQWLKQLGCDLDPLRRCPWYQQLDIRLPLFADAGFVLLQAELIRRTMARHGMALSKIVVRPVDVEEWNGLIAQTNNKSRAHFHAYGEVISRLLDALPGNGHLVADRCGGRMHYGTELRRLRPGARIEILREEPAISSYRLHQAEREALLTFAEKGEDRAFPTALASCFAKYTRELMIHVLNEWFTHKVTGILPTAGYFVDGHRFLNALAPHWDALALPRELLVRVR